MAEWWRGSPPASCIADLLMQHDMSVCILSHLGAVALCRAKCVCSALRKVIESHGPALWGRLILGPQIEPYALPGMEASAESFRELDAIRRAWHDAVGTQQFIHFKASVQALRVDATTQTLVVGLVSGHTQLYSWRDSLDEMPQGPFDFLGRHLTPVLSVDFNTAAEICLSASGEPSYHVTVCKYAQLHVYKTSTRIRVHRLTQHTDSINVVRLTEDPTIAISGSSDASLVVWDVCKGVSLRVLTGHAASVSCLCVVGERVLSGSHDGTLREWGWRSGRCFRVLHLEPRLIPVTALPPPCVPPTCVSALSYYQRSRTLAVGDCAGGLRLIEWERMELQVCDGAGSDLDEAAEVALEAADGLEASANARGGDGSGTTAAPVEPYLHVERIHSSRFMYTGNELEVASVQHDGDKLVYLDRGGQLAAVALERGCVMLHSLWQKKILRANCSTVAFDGQLLVTDGYDNCVSMAWFGQRIDDLPAAI